MESPIVYISNGKLKGLVMTDYDGNDIYAFLGVPYARPAFGNLRFKAPLPPDPWEGIKDATNNGDKCIQRDFYTKPKGIVEGSENCLHLNIYTRELPGYNPTKLKPVMVWIHGGAFQNGSNRSEMYGPEYLLTQDIVLVSVNYRLGILGFLNLENSSFEVYGNGGLKDQQLALKWVQKNIHAFNGDSQNVTIFGESAGGVSVHYHVFSPSSTGLFHKAILQSGIAINTWANETVQPTSLIEFAKFLDKDFQHDAEALDFLRTVSVEDLFIAQEKYVAEKNKFGIQLLFTPVIEKPNDTALITNKPIDLMSSGQFNKVPMMFGYTSAEGLIFVIDKKMKQSEGIEVGTNVPKVEDFLPRASKQKGNLEMIQKVYDKMTNMYKDDELNVKLLSDLLFISGINSAVKFHSMASKNPVYLYRMDLDDDLNLMKKMDPSLNIDMPGMSHADDLGYIFSNESIPRPKEGSSAETAMRRIVKLWTNFAKYSTPIRNESEFNVLWKPVTKNAINFLNIGPELIADINPDEERVQLWEEITKIAENSE